MHLEQWQLSRLARNVPYLWQSETNKVGCSGFLSSAALPIVIKMRNNAIRTSITPAFNACIHLRFDNRFDILRPNQTHADEYPDYWENYITSTTNKALKNDINAK